MLDAFKRLGVTGREIKRGEVYLLKDDLVDFPEDRLPTNPSRTKHERRPVLIIQTDEDNCDIYYPCLLIAPLSHRTDLKSNRDYELKAKQAGLDQDSIVHLGLLQPILKIDLDANPIGKLDPLAMTDVDSLLAANLGLIERP